LGEVVLMVRLLMLLLAAGSVVLLLAATCEPPVMDPSQDPELDASPPEQSACSDTCAEYERLGCEEAEPTEDGGECEDVCENAAESGWVLAKEQGCLERAQTCEEARGCPKRE
jgi:hypothetical protein